MDEHPDRNWEAATWAGSRRAQLRRAMRRTPRARLEAMVALSGTASLLAQAGRADRRGDDHPTADTGRNENRSSSD